MKYVVHTGDLTIVIDQFNSDGTLNRIITLHMGETRNGVQYPFRYRTITEKFGF